MYVHGIIRLIPVLIIDGMWYCKKQVIITSVYVSEFCKLWTHIVFTTQIAAILKSEKKKKETPVTHCRLSNCRWWTVETELRFREKKKIKISDSDSISASPLCAIIVNEANHFFPRFIEVDFSTSHECLLSSVEKNRWMRSDTS